MASLSATPIRRLEGITYWVIDDPEAIFDFINTEVRKEWEVDAKSEHRDPKHDPWLDALSKRRWCLEIMGMSQIKLNPEIMNYVDPDRNYVFSQSLNKRCSELRRSIRLGGLALPPLVVRKEDSQLVDGYCRYDTLKSMNVTRTYAYVGTL
jgi:hypothetical protein